MVKPYKKLIILVIGLGLLTIFLTSCAITPKAKITPLTSKAFLPLREDSDVLLTEGDIQKPYVEIAIIDAIVGYANLERVNNELKKKARALGGDAVINIKYETFYWGAPPGLGLSAIGTVIKRSGNE